MELKLCDLLFYKKFLWKMKKSESRLEKKRCERRNFKNK